MNRLYEAEFYDRIRSGSGRSASIILPPLRQRFRVGSAVDIGCGSGSWLSVIRGLGVDDVLGVDGPWAAGATLLIPSDNFLECDLSQSLPEIDRRFDLAISTEVAEHLPPERSAGLVDLLCSLADVVVFSAAIPRQGGIGHVNERWPSYWAGLFRDRGYGTLDIIRPPVWDNSDVEFWYRQNMLVYARGVGDEVTMLDVVHPAMAERGLSREKGRAERFARARAQWMRDRVDRLRHR